VTPTVIVPDGDANPFLAGGAFSGSDVTVSADGGDLLAYQAIPEGDGPHAAVIVIHENQGLGPYTRDVVDGLTSSGFVAVAPDLLSHEGGTANAGNVSSALRGISMDRHVSDVDAVVAYLRSQPNIGEIGFIDFCFGGGVVCNVVTRNSGITAAIRGIYAGLGDRINGGIPAITEALAAAGVTHELEVYPDSQHSFLNHGNSGRYNATTAPEAWADALAWLTAHLSES
jgi:carboxymethylenebutenolidase